MEKIIGSWLLAFGFWLLASGSWLLALGFWLLAFGLFVNKVNVCDTYPKFRDFMNFV